MRAVGIKELKNKLSEYVRIAASGEPVLVTDRGRVVAELKAPQPQPQQPAASPAMTVAEAKWAELIRRGIVTPAADKSKGPPPKLPAIMTREELLEELARDREDRW
jgi:antitoxin (DNA-binding transcriptional repressor) of toxin-antitoxin stability system